MTRSRLPLYHVSGIEWDTDEEDQAALNLPSEVVMEDHPEGFADMLSDHFGWCITSLCAVEVPNRDDQRLAELQFFGAGSPSRLANAH